MKKSSAPSTPVAAPKETKKNDPDKNKASSDMYLDLLIPEDQIDQEVPMSISRAQALQDLDVVERIVRRGYAGFYVYRELGFDWDAFFGKLRQNLMEWSDPIPTNNFWSFLTREFWELEDTHLGFHAILDVENFIEATPIPHYDAYTTSLYYDFDSSGRLVVTGANPRFAGQARIGIPSRTGKGFTEAVRKMPEGSVVIGFKKQEGLIIAPTLLRRKGALVPGFLVLVMSTLEPEPVHCRILQPDGKKSDWVLPLHRLLIADSEISPYPIYDRDENDSSWLAIRSFDGPSSEEFENFVNAANNLAGEKTIQIDLRGNDGGIIHYTGDWAKNLGLGHLHNMHKISFFSEVVYQGLININQLFLASEDLDEGTITQYNDNIKLLMKELMDLHKKQQGKPFLVFQLEEDPIDKKPSKPPYNGSILALADAGCASACENLVHIIKQGSNNIILGENTNGCMTFADMLYFRLPNSKLWFSLGSSYYASVLKDEPMIDGAGFFPHFWLDTDRPEEIQKSLAACLKQPDCDRRIRSFLERYNSMAEK